MNCLKCGNVLPPNTVLCPFCGEPCAVQAGYGASQPDPAAQSGQFEPIHSGAPDVSYSPQGYAAPPIYTRQGFTPQGYPPQSYVPQGYAPQSDPYQAQQAQPQNDVYQQNYRQYSVGSAMPGFQQPLHYDQSGSGRPNRITAMLKELPQKFIGSILRPSEVLRSSMESRDAISGASAAGLAILLSFLFGMVLVRTVITALAVDMSSSAGSLSGNDMTVISRMIGMISPGIGGIYALCQALVLLTPIAVSMIYICVIRKARFSVELLMGYLTVTALPVCGFLLLMILLSFISTWLAVLPLVSSAVVTCVQISSLMAYITGRTENELHIERIICCSISISLCVMFTALVGGSLVKGSVESLFSSAGSSFLGSFL